MKKIGTVWYDEDKKLIKIITSFGEKRLFIGEFRDFIADLSVAEERYEGLLNEILSLKSAENSV